MSDYPHVLFRFRLSIQCHSLLDDLIEKNVISIAFTNFSLKNNFTGQDFWQEVIIFEVWVERSKSCAIKLSIKKRISE